MRESLMVHKWVLDVLADLQSFAKSNDLNVLAAHLEEAGYIAAAEICAQADGVTQHNHGESAANRTHPPGRGCLDRA